jgi:DNA-binding response OmpR family regulator
VLYTDSLKTMGFSVVHATEVSEIVRESTIRQFQLVILGYLHAESSALHVVSGLRDQGVAAPILITTANPADPVLQSAVSRVHVLIKPFDSTEFRDAVRYLRRILCSAPSRLITKANSSPVPS